MARTICTVSWSDVLGGAGIQADASTFSMLGVTATSVLTGVAAHNTVGTAMNQEVDDQILRVQFEGLWLAIPPTVIKCGALFSIRIMTEVLHWLKHFSGHVIYDPVIFSPAGEVLLDTSAIQYLKANFLSHVSVLTANFSQLVYLYGGAIEGDSAVKEAICYLSTLGVRSVLLKVGAHEGYYRSYWWSADQGFWLRSCLHSNGCTYGAGSMLSAAVAAFLFRGMALFESFAMAQIYVSGCIRRGDPVGHISYARCGMIDYSDQDRLLVGQDKDIPIDEGFFPFAKELGRYKKRYHSGLRSFEALVWACGVDEARSDRLRVIQHACRSAGSLFCLEGSLSQAIEYAVDMVLVSFADWEEALRQDLLRDKIHVGIKVHNQIELIRASSLRPSFLVVSQKAFNDSLGDFAITHEGLSFWSNVVSCSVLVEDRLGYCRFLNHKNTCPLALAEAKV